MTKSKERVCLCVRFSPFFSLIFFWSPRRFFFIPHFHFGSRIAREEKNSNSLMVQFRSEFLSCMCIYVVHFTFSPTSTNVKRNSILWISHDFPSVYLFNRSSIFPLSSNKLIPFDNPASSNAGALSSFPVAQR